MGGAAENADIRLVRRRMRKKVLREVFLYKDLVVKRFVRLSRLADPRPVWQMEDQALRRLAGYPFPETHGFSIKGSRGAEEVIYVREYVPGRPVERISSAEIERVADLLAYIHRRGVLTCDPAPENFIRLADGRLSFIDFGRAKVMKNRGGRYLYHLGKELARVEHHTFSNDRDRFARFYDAYKKRIGLPKAAKLLVHLSCRAWAARWRLRLRLRERRRG